MKEVTIHEAKTHLSRLLKDVAQGEIVVILRGSHPVARLVPTDATEPIPRPRIGESTSSDVHWTEDAFEPLSDEDLKEWGL